MIISPPVTAPGISMVGEIVTMFWNTAVNTTSLALCNWLSVSLSENEVRVGKAIESNDDLAISLVNETMKGNNTASPHNRSFLIGVMLLLLFKGSFYFFISSKGFFTISEFIFQIHFNGSSTKGCFV